jgi:Rieske 2Fe-2S family protein
MVDFWDLTNRQDWALCERVQRGAASAGYAPGPYHATERCVHAFDTWYAEAIAPLLGTSMS